MHGRNGFAMISIEMRDVYAFKLFQHETMELRPTFQISRVDHILCCPERREPADPLVEWLRSFAHNTSVVDGLCKIQLITILKTTKNPVSTSMDFQTIDCHWCTISTFCGLSLHNGSIL